MATSSPSFLSIRASTVPNRGTLDGALSQADAINDAGQSAGFAFTEGDAAQYAFVYGGGVMTDLGTLGGTTSYVGAVDGVGQIAGTSTTTSCRLCIYDSTPGVETVVARLEIDPNATWLDKNPKGWNYVDSTKTEDGVHKLQLKTGADGKTKAQLGAKGTNLPMPLPFSGTEPFDNDLSVTAQLFNDATPTCWSSELTTALINTVTRFKATTA